MFPLPRGATGFSRAEHGPLPETGVRAFRTALHAAARAAGGQVGTVEERTYPRTFHTASIIRRDDERVVLCHAHHPWIAFAEERRTWYDDGFASPSPPRYLSRGPAMGRLAPGPGMAVCPLSRA